MKATFTLAHLSDLHISLHHSRQNIRSTRRLVEHALCHNVDHIVVTGDIAANAEKSELAAARKIFQSYGLLDTHRMSIVIGNHDIYGGVYTAEDILTFPRRCKRTDYERRISEFHDAFGELFEGSVHGKHARLFPFVKVLNGVALYGMNSVARYSRIGNPIGSNGEVDDRQFERLKALLGSELFRKDRKIVLVHHHFNRLDVGEGGTIHSLWGAVERQTLKLHGKKRLLKLFAAHNVDLVLHGHVHANAEYVRAGVHFVNSGGSIIADVPAVPQATIISIGEHGIRTEFRRLSPDIQKRSLIPLPSDPQEVPIQVAA